MIKILVHTFASRPLYSFVDNDIALDIEDLTQVVFSYEIYYTSLRTSVRCVLK